MRPWPRMPRGGSRSRWPPRSNRSTWRWPPGFSCTRSCVTPETALIWAFMVWRHGVSLEALRGAAFATVLLGIAMTDARAYIIPDEFSLGGLVLGILFALAAGRGAFGTALLGAAVGFV